MDSLRDRVVCITGASSGIGAGAALAFANYGSKLALCGRNSERLEQVALQCRELIKDENVITILGDLLDEGCVEKIAKTILDKFGTIHVLVNNAGTGAFGYSSTVSLDAMEQMMKLHVYSPLRLSQLFMDHLLKNKGAIVNIASGVTSHPVAGLIAYNCAKSAQLNMTKTMALELAKQGVRVNSVSPGWIETSIRPSTDSSGEEFFNELAPYLVSGQAGKCSECAQVIAFLASDAASYINGQNIHVDKGDNLAVKMYCNPVVTKLFD